MATDSRPLVSVVIPCYNCAATVNRAVDSALAQQVSVEVILIDDASPQDLSEALSVYAEDPRVRILKNSENRGVAVSRNRGVAESMGEYVAFLDSDDWWEEGKLAAQMAVMEAEDVVLCCTGRELMNADGSSRGRVISVEKNITYRTLLAHNCINCSSVLLRAHVAREFPMEHDEAHEDYIMWLRILRKYGRAAGIDHPYLKYRLAAGSKSGNKLKSARMTYMVYRHMGYSHVSSCVFFISYALHGVWKYYGRR